jgi:hypothetical protein
MKTIAITIPAIIIMHPTSGCATTNTESNIPLEEPKLSLEEQARLQVEAGWEPEPLGRTTAEPPALPVPPRQVETHESTGPTFGQVVLGILGALVQNRIENGPTYQRREPASTSFRSGCCLQIKPKAYGLGVGMDQYGRPVRIVPQ